MKGKDQVITWIHDHFNVEDITIEEFPIMPAGHIIRDRDGGEMLVFFDILHGKVDHKLPDQGGYNIGH